MKLSMKRFLTVIILSIMVITCSVGIPLDARAETSGNITWKIDGETLTISGTGDMPKYEEYEQPWADSAFDITKVIIGEGITSVSEYAFYRMYCIKTVKLPSTLKRIDANAFGSTSISEIKLSEGLTTLGDYAFLNTPLTQINIPASVSSANWPLVFLNCKDMESITIASGNKKYTTSGKAVLTKDKKTLLHFLQKSDFTSYDVPSFVEKIGDKAFYCNYSLIKINLHDKINTIGDKAFSSCSALEEVVIPNSVTTLGENVFDESRNIKKATIGKGIINLSYALFYNCENLEEVNLLGKVKNINDLVFVRCSKLKTIVLPDTVEYIGSAAFRDCKSLQSLSIPSAMKYIEASAFEGCTNLKLDLPDTLLKLKDGAYIRGSVVKVEGTQKYDMAFEVLERVNKEREDRGIPAVVMDKGLLDQAMQRAAECYVRFGHANPLGLYDLAYGWAETLTIDYSAKGAVSSWMNSELHREISLGEGWKSVGVGCFETEVGTFFVQIFGDEVKNPATKPSDKTQNVSINTNIDDFEINLSTEDENRTYSKGKTFTITAFSSDMNPEYTHWYSAILHPSTFTWKSSNTDIVKVDQTGKCTAVGVGKATITATIKQGVKKSYTMNLEVVASTELSTPIVSKTNDSATGKPKLTWKKVGGAAKYEVYRYDSAKKTYVKMYTTTNTSYTNTSAEAGKTYYYKVKAISSSYSIKSSITDAISITCKYPAPKITGSNDSATGKCKLTWKKVDGATKYEIYKYDNAKKEYVKYYTTTSTSFTNSSVTAGTVHYYKVKAVGSVADATSLFSSPVRLTCKYGTPKVTGTNDAATGKPKLTWAKVDGATKYEIYKYDNAKKEYVKYYTTTSTSFTNSSVTAGTVHYYKVKAVGSVADATSLFSSPVRLTCKYGTPKVTGSNDATTGKPKLTWPKVDGATKYEIYKYDGVKKEYIKYYTTMSTSFTNSSTQAGTVHYYKVKAVGSVADATSLFSSPVRLTCKYGTPKVTGSNDAATGKPKLTWPKVDGATKYEIYKYDGVKKEYIKYYTTTSTSFTNSSAQTGSVNYYKVKAIGSTSEANSAMSSPVRIVSR